MMKKTKRSLPFIYKWLAGLLLFAVMFLSAMRLGAADITLEDVWLSLTSRAADDHLALIREIRLPREIAAVAVGAALAVAGAIMQGMTRNPLADPGLLGLTAGANAALVITIALLPGAGNLMMVTACFFGAAVGVGMVFGIGTLARGGFSPLRMVLAGAAVSALLYAFAEGVALYFNISKDVSMWTAGGLVGMSWIQMRAVGPFLALGIAIALLLARQLTILSLNEEVAVGLGQKTNRIKALLIAVIVLLAGASVALVGNLAFIGLMIPHIARAVVGTDYRYVMPMSAIIGASFMLLADTLGRTIHAPYETPIAAIIAIVGLPFFLFIVRKGGKVFS
jgi:iron complex transport system permease protein